MNEPVIDRQYEDLLADVLANGVIKNDRTGTGTRSVFARQLRYDLSKSFPLITTKRVFLRGVVVELLWFLTGSSNIADLSAQNVHIWDDWADADGELGPVYGVQWRSWPDPVNNTTIDQIDKLITGLREDPDSRRHIVSAWNVAQLEQMALAPCHAFFQVWVGDGKLSLQIYQRSADLFLGVPFNIASYALLTQMLADQTGYQVGELIWTGGDCHIYNNHIEQVKTQLAREPYPFPTLELAKRPSIDAYRPEDIQVKDYRYHPTIKAPIAV